MMKNVKRLLVLCLALVMCLTAMSVTSFAADFNPTFVLNRRYDPNTNILDLNIKTDAPYGGVIATVEYPIGATFKLESSKIVEKAATAGQISEGTNTVTFAATVNAEDIATGTDNWASLSFDLGTLKNATFKVKAVQICDINENLATTLPEASMTIKLDNLLNNLGSQYRTETADWKAALRFGTQLNRDKATNTVTVDGVQYAIASCGFAIAPKDTLVAAGAEIGGTVDATTGAIVKNHEKVQIVEAKKYLSSTNTALIYSVAITFGAGDTSNYDKAIQAKPYVIYKKGDTYAIEWGDVMENTFNNVKNIYEGI